MDWQTILVTLAGAVMLILAKEAVGFLVKRQKMAGEQRLQSEVMAQQGIAQRNAQLDAAWAEMIQSNNKRFDELEDQLEECRESHEGCLQREKALATRVAVLEEFKKEQSGERITALIVCTMDGIIQEWSPAATQLFHWQEKEMLGKRVDILIPARLRQEHNLAFRRAAENLNGDSMKERESYGRVKEGLEIPVLIRIYPGWDNQGQRIFSAEISRRQE